MTSPTPSKSESKAQAPVSHAPAAGHHKSSTPAPHAPPSHPSGGKWSFIIWCLAGALGAGGAVYWAKETFFHAPNAEVVKSTPVSFENTPWDGRVDVSDEAQAALSLATVPVVPQTEAIRLPLLGTTKHDETKVTKIRPLFKGRVEKVHVNVGETVEVGKPLVDLYSTDLAQAKTTYEIEMNQWKHEKNLLDVRTELRKTNAISEQLLLDTQTDELRQRHEYEIAREKLLILGLSDQEIAAVPEEKGAQRLRLTVRSPAAGVVIMRDAVSGNIYDDSDVMMVIAPEDHLWVWGNVFERDLSLVQIGQKWDVQFSFLQDKLLGSVEYISPGVDPNTHAVRVRTSIPNPGLRLKSDMLARGALHIPPKPGFTVIPRNAMIVVDGSSYAFVRDPQIATKFSRRKLRVAHESDDRVVVETGLQPDENVVVIGALILQQLHSEREVLETGRVVGNSDGSPQH
ncbi:MAG: efflux RND transporter periplasmic adaptor subunit [Planctomycetaceae bacterium]